MRDGTSYSMAHKNLRKLRGPARSHPCIDCGEQARDWSYNGGAPDERMGFVHGHKRPLAYSFDPAYYSPRCLDCHKLYDTRTAPSPFSKLTPAQVTEIFTSTEPHKVISDRLGVDFTTVSSIRRRKIWTWFTKDLPDVTYERIPRSNRRKLTDEQIIEIFTSPESHKEISDRIGVSTFDAIHVRTKVTGKYLTDSLPTIAYRDGRT